MTSLLHQSNLSRDIDFVREDRVMTLSGSKIPCTCVSSRISYSSFDGFRKRPTTDCVVLLIIFITTDASHSRKSKGGLHTARISNTQLRAMNLHVVNICVRIKEIQICSKTEDRWPLDAVHNWERRGAGAESLQTARSASCTSLCAAFGRFSDVA